VIQNGASYGRMPARNSIKVSEFLTEERLRKFPRIQSWWGYPYLNLLGTSA